MSSTHPFDGERREQARNDRRSAHTYTGPDGTLMFGDCAGGEWRVFDRRSGERRENERGRSEVAFYRAFINAAGEEWRCELTREELIDDTASGLEQQLARAVRHQETAQ